MTSLLKPVSLFTAFILLITSCSPKRKQIPINTLKDVFTNLAPAVQEFEVDPANETHFTGKKGTSVYIPVDAFQFADGTSPTSAIKIELKECYSLSDMIAENLSTMSGPEILETGGMIYFNATSGGKQLSVKEGKAFVVSFPKGTQKNEMDLFYNVTLGDTLSTWVPDYAMFALEPDTSMQTDSVEETWQGDIAVRQPKYPIDLTDDLFDFRLDPILIDNTFFTLPLAGKQTTILDYFNEPTPIGDSIFRKLGDDYWTVAYEFQIDKNGKITNVKPGRNRNSGNQPYAYKIIKRHLEGAPPFNVTLDAIKIDHNRFYQLGFTGHRRLNQDRYKKRFREKYSQYTNKAIEKIDKNELDFYTMSATKMGWINCDRFWDLAEVEKTNFVVNTSTITDTKILIVFKDIKSIMNPTRQEENAIFENLPLGKPIKVIGISYANGKPTMAVNETVVDGDGFDLKDFKEFSLDDLERELNQ